MRLQLNAAVMAASLSVKADEEQRGRGLGRVQRTKQGGVHGREQPQKNMCGEVELSIISGRRVITHHTKKGLSLNYAFAALSFPAACGIRIAARRT